MSILKKYYNQIIKIDLSNKYSYVNLKKIPKVKKIILNFGCKDSNFFSISSTLLFLELISKKKSKVTRARRPNVLLKIRKGNIVGCSVTLTKSCMYNFLLTLIKNIFPNFKNFKGIQVFRKKLLKESFSFTIKDFVCFKELEKQFYLFPKLSPLNITILFANIKTKNELLYILKSFKFPLLVKEGEQKQL